MNPSRSLAVLSCLAVIAAAAAMLAGCTQQPSVATPAPTGITANNGGGVKTLNNQPNIGVTTVVRP